MNILDSHNHFNLDKLFYDPMSKIYIYQALLTFAKSMVGIFVPVYLYKLGYSLIEVILYLVGNSVVYLLLIPFSLNLINKIGFKRMILLSTPIYIIYLSSLYYINYSNIFYFISIFLLGTYLSFFWPAMHSEIALNLSKKHRGSQLGTLQIIMTLVGTIAPFIGGYFLENLSYWYLLLLASFLIFLGTIPLLLSEDIKLNKYSISFKEYIALLVLKKNINSKIAFSSEGLESILNVAIWPIFVFILLSENFLSLGFLYTIVSFISIFFILYFKRYIDSNNRKKYLSLIVKFLSLNWFLRFLVFLFGGVFLYFVESMSKLVLNMFSMSFMSIFYSNAEKFGYMDYIILRELYLHGTKILVSIFIFIPFIYFFGESLITLSALILYGVFFSFGLSYLREE